MDESKNNHKSLTAQKTTTLNTKLGKTQEINQVRCILDIYSTIAIHHTRVEHLKNVLVTWY